MGLPVTDGEDPTASGGAPSTVTDRSVSASLVAPRTGLVNLVLTNFSSSHASVLSNRGVHSINPIGSSGEIRA